VEEIVKWKNLCKTPSKKCF